MAGPSFSAEVRLIAAGEGHVAGVDEAGRGPLAGPVVAAAVILDPGKLPRGVADSKLLDREEREKAFARILRGALAVSVGAVGAGEIDATDIRKATLLAMGRAIEGLCLAPRHVLVDGRDSPPVPLAVTPIVDGDATVLSIAAASIVAKVTRDAMMRRLCALHAGYGFERNAGYGTPEHLAALALHGPTPVHRMSFRPLRAE